MAAVHDIIEQGTDELLEESEEETLGAAVPVGETDGLQLGHQRTKFPFLSRRTAFLAGAGFFALALVAALAAWRSGEAGSAGAQGMSQWDPDDQAIMVKILEEQSGRSLAENEKQALKVVIPHTGITSLLKFQVARMEDVTDECRNAVTAHMEHLLKKASVIIMKATMLCKDGGEQTHKCQATLNATRHYKRVIVRQCNADPAFDLCEAESEVHLRNGSYETKSEEVCIPEECQDEYNIQVLEQRFTHQVCTAFNETYTSCLVDVYCGAAPTGSEGSI